MYTTMHFCAILLVPSCRATRKRQEGWDTAKLPKPRQGKSRDRGRVRTTDLPVYFESEGRWFKPDLRLFTPLSKFGQSGSIPALVLPSGGMAVRLRKGDSGCRIPIDEDGKSIQNRNKSGCGRDMELVHCNNSEVPTPPNTRSGNLDRN
ncbi:hypothetical protein T265_03957 [Opisthorchis viverrini]|uniref:Secreted protein n=1 Tax=Opisthorchis viverrini TaxID=6198 RepID=A0A074ZQI3_OPIVI|nr:hypothetical protein T265_03957 [Opisthorchis viverrini]KER29386.1 hypothetical protein T265_03957 [Opisthorchis viverrini]